MEFYMTLETRVMSCSSSHTVAATGDTLLFFWQREVTAVSVDATRACQVEMRAAWPRGVRILAVIAPGTSLPSAEVRHQAALVDGDLQHDVRAHATVLAGGGRWMAGARALLGAFFALTGTVYPRRVFGTVKDALQWLDSFEGQSDYETLGVKVQEMLHTGEGKP